MSVSFRQIVTYENGRVVLSSGSSAVDDDQFIINLARKSMTTEDASLGLVIVGQTISHSKVIFVNNDEFSDVKVGDLLTEFELMDLIA